MKYIIIIVIGVFIISCSKNSSKSDAFGNFEADEIIISSESIGKINNLVVKEGEKVVKGQIIAVIDTVQLDIQKNQILANMTAISAKRQDVKVQVDVLNERKSNLIREKNRLTNMFKEGSATQKQLDDINGEIEVVEKNIIATQTGLNNVNFGLMSELKPLKEQLRLIEDKIFKSKIISPSDGNVLIKFIQNGEFVSIGKPVLKIANIDELYLKVYINGTMLPNVKLNQNVDVLIDKTESENEKLIGKVTWISDKAEFTPKIVQTK